MISQQEINKKIEERIEKIEPLLKYNHEWILQHIQDSFDKEKPKDSEIIYAKESFEDLRKMLDQQRIIIGDKNNEIERLKEANAALASLVQNQKNIAGLEEKCERLESELYDKEQDRRILMKIIEKALEYIRVHFVGYLDPLKEILGGKS